MALSDNAGHRRRGALPFLGRIVERAALRGHLVHMRLGIEKLLI